MYIVGFLNKKTNFVTVCLLAYKHGGFGFK